MWWNKKKNQKQKRVILTSLSVPAELDCGHIVCAGQLCRSNNTGSVQKVNIICHRSLGTMCYISVDRFSGIIIWKHGQRMQCGQEKKKKQSKQQQHKKEILLKVVVFFIGVKGQQAMNKKMLTSEVTF